MQSLQGYLEQNINEGELWDSIKQWFKDLFDPESDKQYSRYVDSEDENHLSGSNLSNYKDYLENNFNKENIQIKVLNDKELKKVVYPAGVEPNKEDGIGFYEFIDYAEDKNHKGSTYIGFLYNTKEVSDTPALIQVKYDTETFEIIKLQIIEEFENELSISDIINIISKKQEIIKNCTSIIVNETTNKELFNQVINDCNFKKIYSKESDSNIAKLSLKKNNK